LVATTGTLSIKLAGIEIGNVIVTGSDRTRVNALIYAVSASRYLNVI
jgi:hypothetical protein